MTNHNAGQPDPGEPPPPTPLDQDDPVIAEVRAIRRQMLTEAGGDIGRMLDLAAQQAAAFRLAAQQRRRQRPGEAA
jgi:hypothetical protein